MDDLEGFDMFPAIVKPSDSQGQRGITVVNDASEAQSAVARSLPFSASGTAIIEEWLEGPEISIHVFAVDGEVRFFLPSDRIVWEGDLIGVAAGHVLPARTLDPSTGVEVRRVVETFVTTFDVSTGPLYFQMKLTSAGPRVIEVASRFDGCHMWRLILQHTGFNLMEAAFDILAGGTWKAPAPWDESRTDTLRFHLGPPDKAFRNTDYPTIGKVTFRELQVDEGDLPRDANGVVCRMGYYMTTSA
jgi:biotin carboxylase